MMIFKNSKHILLDQLTVELKVNKTKETTRLKLKIYLFKEQVYNIKIITVRQKNHMLISFYLQIFSLRYETFKYLHTYGHVSIGQFDIKLSNPNETKVKNIGHK